MTFGALILTHFNDCCIAVLAPKYHGTLISIEWTKVCPPSSNICIHMCFPVLHFDHKSLVNPVQSTAFQTLLRWDPTKHYCSDSSLFWGFNTELKKVKFLYKQCKNKGALHKNTVVTHRRRQTAEKRTRITK